MAQITPALRAFLADWLAWAEDGAPFRGHDDFRPYMGLCGNSDKRGHSVTMDLRQAFEDDGICLYYPFCTDEEYEEMTDDDTQHLCEARLAWVREKLEQSA